MNSKLDNIKMIFLDIDGTLYNSEKQVTEYTKSIINRVKEKGIDIVLCSGRSNLSVSELSKDINASRYVIACNGAFVYNYKDNIDIFQNPMKIENIEKIWDFCKKKNIELIIEAKIEKYVNFKDSGKGEIMLNNPQEILDKKIFQMVIDNVEIEDTKEIRELLKNSEEMWSANYGINGSNKYFFDINNKNTDKGTGISELNKYLGIKNEDTIGFGDGINDYAMFRECGIGVAMGNAEEELKKVADYIALTNNEDGVAKFIEKYILKE